MLLAAAIGCGKRGDPRPPLRKNPEPPAALAIAQRGELLQVSCAAPRLTLDGARLGVMDIQLLRADGEGDFERLAKLATQMKAAPGEILVLDEVKPELGSLVRFSAIARSEKHDSAPVGPLSFAVREIPPAPTALSAELQPNKVVLNWSEALPSTLPPPPPAALPASAGPSPEAESADVPPGPPREADPAAPSLPEPTPELAAPGSAVATDAVLEPTPEPSPAPTPPAVGVLIYRRQADEDYGPSLNSAPLAVSGFVDTGAPLDTELCYAARTVVSLQPFVESGDSEEACLLFEDIAPPEAVVGVTLLRQAEGIEVSWSPSQSADLLAFRVYRAHRGEPPVLLAELTPDILNYLDPNPPPAAILEYTITALDSSGNEGAPSDTERIRTQ